MPLSECSDQRSPYNMGKALQQRSDLHEWGGVTFSDDELAGYRAMYMYNEVKRLGEPRQLPFT